MSFGIKVFSGVQEALVLALMLVAFLAIFSVPNMDFTLKISIAVIVFTIIFLATLAAGLLRQQREIKRAQA